LSSPPLLPPPSPSPSPSTATAAIQIINPTRKTHTLLANTPRENVPTPQTWKVIFIWFVVTTTSPAPTELALLMSKSFQPYLSCWSQKIGNRYSDITTNWPSSKLSHRQPSPFTVEACIGHGAYHLTLPP
jgi:hypothetical protein